MRNRAAASRGWRASSAAADSTPITRAAGSLAYRNRPSTVVIVIPSAAFRRTISSRSRTTCSPDSSPRAVAPSTTSLNPFVPPGSPACGHITPTGQQPPAILEADGAVHGRRGRAREAVPPTAVRVARIRRGDHDGRPARAHASRSSVAVVGGGGRRTCRSRGGSLVLDVADGMVASAARARLGSHDAGDAVVGARPSARARGRCRPDGRRRRRAAHRRARAPERVAVAERCGGRAARGDRLVSRAGRPRAGLQPVPAARRCARRGVTDALGSRREPPFGTCSWRTRADARER